MKKIMSLLLILVMVMSVSLFNVSAIEGVVDSENDFKDDCILLVVNDSSYEVTLQNLSQYGVIEIDDHLSHIGVYILTLDKHDHDNTRSVAEALNNASEGRYVAELNYRMYPADTPVKEPTEEELRQKFVEYLGISSDVEYTYSGPLYSHYEDSAQAPSWVLVDGYGGRYLPADMLFGVFDDYYLYGCSSRPSNFNYHVYITDEQKFYSLEDAWSKDICSKEEIFTQYLMPEKCAYLIGDANNDKVLSVLDATIIQQAEAKISFLDDWIMASHVYGDKIVFSTDFNRDGERSILDATAIQMKLAKVEDTVTK